MSSLPPGCDIRLVNGSTGDPALWIDHAGRDDAFLFDAGDNALPMERLADLHGVFVTHLHMDHFVGLDRILRANLDRDKTLTVIGPEGLIQAVHQRLSSYVHQWFPFQKLVLELVEVKGDRLSRATLPFLERLPPPEPVQEPWRGSIVFEDDQFTVEATAVDHTAPCLAFALVERPGWRVDPEKLAKAPLKSGSWIEAARRMLEDEVDPARSVEVAGGRFPLGTLADLCFSRTGGGRIAYVTDTRWNDVSKPALTRLARKAKRLYCDASYAETERKAAEKYGHMTAVDAADLAASAQVRELVLMHFSKRYAGSYDRLVSEARTRFEPTRAEIPSSPANS
jgi:ribonuclease Z